MPDYFGNFRIGPDSRRTVTLADGTTKVIPVVSNPIDSGVSDIRFNGKRLTKKLKRELWERDKDRPWFSRALG